VKRGLKGARPVVSDAHEGLKAAIACVSGATWQRCRVRWAVHGLGRAAQAFLQPDAASARQTWRHMADQLRPRWPKLGAPMDESDVLAYMAFPAQHRTKLRPVNTLERLNKGARHRLAQAARRRGRHLPLRGVDPAADRRGAARGE
jgi:putative transposase